MSFLATSDLVPAPLGTSKNSIDEDGCVWCVWRVCCGQLRISVFLHTFAYFSALVAS